VREPVPALAPRNDSSPVDARERLLRRVARNDYKPDLPVSVQRGGFVPSKYDTDGLSLFREDFVTPEAVAAAGPSPNGYAVARLLVQDLLDLKLPGGLSLTVVPAPDPDQPPGHCLIPQLNRSYHDSHKQHAKEVELALAELASKDVPYVEPPRGPA
jgi:hypothetical protein